MNAKDINEAIEWYQIGLITFNELCDNAKRFGKIVTRTEDGRWMTVTTEPVEFHATIDTSIKRNSSRG